MKEEREMAEGASVPALGLSNKAVFTDTASGNASENSQLKDSESYFIPQHLTGLSAT